jgi:hypothetical protein
MKGKAMNEVTYTQDSLTISNVCPECIAQETLCVDCVELADARLTDKAYESASEGNLMYKSQWLVDTEPSGHDWTDREGEYKLPIVQLQDGGILDNLWELEDYTQSMREVICQACHLTTPKQFNDCQCCDAPLEHNVSASLMREISKFVK